MSTVCSELNSHCAVVFLLNFALIFVLILLLLLLLFHSYLLRFGLAAVETKYFFPPNPSCFHPYSLLALSS